MSSDNFITKDSGQRVVFETGMNRDVSEDKPAFHLLLAKGVPYSEQFITRWAELMQRGAVKYNERNWEKARTQVELDRFYSSALRHLLQAMCGEKDEDHLAAVAFNIAGAAYVEYRMKVDMEKLVTATETASNTLRALGDYQERMNF